MFVKPNIFKSSMKAAYKGAGLRVARADGKLYLGGRYWEAESEMNYVPKKTMAALVELTGQIPEEGEQYDATTEGNQYEEFLETEIPRGGEDLEVTDLIIRTKNGEFRILQNPCKGEITLVSNKIVEMIDKIEAMANREEDPVGPKLNRGGLLWENKEGAFWVGRCELEKKQSLLNYLEKFDLTEEDGEEA